MAVFSCCRCVSYSLLLLPPVSSPFPTRRSSDLRLVLLGVAGGSVRTCPCIRMVSSRTSRGRSVAGRSGRARFARRDRKSTRLNSSHVAISYAVFCLKKKKRNEQITEIHSEGRRL